MITLSDPVLPGAPPLSARAVGTQTDPPCRPGCGACCIALSISSPLPSLPQGKAAGERCLHLNRDNTCALYGLAERPAVCRNLRPSRQMCGESVEEALAYLNRLEELTRP